MCNYLTTFIYLACFIERFLPSKSLHPLGWWCDHELVSGAWALERAWCLWAVFQQTQRWWVQGTEPEESRRWRQVFGRRDPDCVSQLRAAVGPKEVHGLTHHSQSPPKISPNEKVTVLGVNSGMKQNIAPSSHSFYDHCNLRICAFMAFFGLLFAPRLNFVLHRADFVLVWVRSEFKDHMLLAVLIAWQWQYSFTYSP